MRFELKAIYGIPELAAMAGISRQRMVRLLERNSCELQRAGRHLKVPLSELLEKMHWIKESMEARDMINDSMAGKLPG